MEPARMPLASGPEWAVALPGDQAELIAFGIAPDLPGAAPAIPQRARLAGPQLRQRHARGRHVRRGNMQVQPVLHDLALRHQLEGQHRTTYAERLEVDPARGP